MVCRVSLGATEAKQQTHGFGLQCAQPTGQAHTVPGVPEPWMGTYGEKLPVIPQGASGIRCAVGLQTSVKLSRTGSFRSAKYVQGWSRMGANAKQAKGGSKEADGHEASNSFKHVCSCTDQH